MSDEVSLEEEGEPVKVSKTTKALLQEIADRLGISPEDVISRAINALIDREQPQLLESSPAGSTSLDSALQSAVNRLASSGDISLKDVAVLMLLHNMSRPQPVYQPPPQQNARDKLIETVGMAMIAKAMSGGDVNQIIPLISKLIEARSTEEIRRILSEYQQSVQQQIAQVQVQAQKPNLEDEIMEAIKDEVADRIRDLIREGIRKGVIKEEEIVTPGGEINWNKLMDDIMKLLRTMAKAQEKKAPPAPPPLPVEEVEKPGPAPGGSQAPHRPSVHEEEARQEVSSPVSREAEAGAPEAGVPEPGEGGGEPEQAGGPGVESAEQASEEPGESRAEEKLEADSKPSKRARKSKKTSARGKAGSKKSG